ncbi:MAG: kelch repeat-containing protein [Myxococcales bacterium]|nr:kelch repeat-containing protein [Myxococcales bacterium]
MKKLALCMLTACGTNAAVVSPVIDVPLNDNASAFPLDEITLAVAHKGSTVDITSATFKKGQAVELSGVPFGDDLVIHMTGRVGTSEVAYGRTCAFSVSSSSDVPTPHLFFSRSVKFADLSGYTPRERVGGNAVTTFDGAGLLLGGIDPNNQTANQDLEHLDPRTGEFRIIGSVQPRVGAMAATLGTDSGSSRIALVGGLDSTTMLGAGFVEIIQPEAAFDRRVDKIDDAQIARENLSATALTDGRIIVIGGQAPNQPVSRDVDEIAIQSGTAAVRQLRAQLTTERQMHTATRLGDDVGASVLVAGGLDHMNLPISDAELFKPLSENFSPTFVAKMKIPRYAHKAVLMPDGSVLMIGGLDAGGNAISTIERFTLDGGFTTVGDLPPNAGRIDFAATTLPDGRVLITGGRRSPLLAPVDAAFIARLDPIDGSVDIVGTDHLSVPRARHQATLLCDGTVFVDGGTTEPVSAERYNPPSAGRR